MIKSAPLTLGSSDVGTKSHQAWSSAMRRIHRARQLGNGPRRNLEQDKPAMLGTARSASDTPADSASPVRYEWAPPPAPLPWWAVAVVLLASGAFVFAFGWLVG
jgi:hypothetical protein